MDTSWKIGIDLGGTKTEVILLDDRHRVHLRTRQPTPRGDYPGTLETVAALVAEAEVAAGRSGLSVGVGIPGTVSRVTGRVKNGNATWLNGQPLREDLGHRLGRPVVLTNDANCLALSEATDGAGAGHEVVFAAILGTGCGGGIAVNKCLLTGPNGLAGEWGHNPLPGATERERAERPCYCGRQGCIETFLSGPGLSLTCLQQTGVKRAAEAIARQALEGDARAQAVLAIYQDQLARGLASVIHVLDPDVVVLGGGLSNLACLYQGLPQRLPAYAFGGEWDTPVRQAVHGDSSGVRGAAWLGQGSPVASFSGPPSDPGISY
ncbi:MAG: ROK family protein [Oleiphilaceae bacterium]|nr:ROK family protein [Oleiphilaceae bacterium]